MEQDLFEALEKRVEGLIARYAALERENAALREENERLHEERNDFKMRIDSVLKKLEGI